MRFEILQAARFCILPRSNAHQSLESPLEVMRAESDLSAQGVQGKRFVGAGINDGADAADQFGLRVAINTIPRVAAAARAKP